MTDFEMVVDYITKCAKEIQEAWYGDDAGDKEDRAMKAFELIGLLDEVVALVKDLDI